MEPFSDGMPHVKDQHKEILDDFAILVRYLPAFNIPILHWLYLNVYPKTAKVEHPDLHSFKMRTFMCTMITESMNVQIANSERWILMRHVKTVDNGEHNLIMREFLAATLNTYDFKNKIFKNTLIDRLEELKELYDN